MPRTRSADLKPDMNWSAAAACSGSDPDLFFTPDPDTIAEAKAICARCGIRRICLERAIAEKEYGVWGGMDEKERAELVKIRERQTA